MDFAVQANHRMKSKQREKIKKYLDLARKLKKLWNMKVTVISFVVSALGTAFNGLITRLRKWKPEKKGDRPDHSNNKIGENT